MVLTKVKLFFGLTDSQKEKGVHPVDETTLGLFKELDSLLQVGVLSSDGNSDDGVLERVELHVEGLDHLVVQLDQVLVLSGVEGHRLGVVNKVFRDLMPHFLAVLERDHLVELIEGGVLEIGRAHV